MTQVTPCESVNAGPGNRHELLKALIFNQLEWEMGKKDRRQKLLFEDFSCISRNVCTGFGPLYGYISKISS